MRAELLMGETDAPAAYDALRAAGELDPDASGPQRVLGSGAKAAGDDSAFGALYAWRGAVRRRQGRLDEAASDFDRSLTLRPDAPWTRAWRGELLLSQGKAADALADLSAAAALLPADADLAVWRGRAYCELGRCAEARADFDRALSHQPNSVWALIAAGACREKAGDPRSAAPFYLRAKSLAPDLFKS